MSGLLLLGVAVGSFIGFHLSKREKKKALRHVVLFRFKEGTEDPTIERLIDGYKDLISKIPLIKGFEYGVDLKLEEYSKGYTHSFILTYDSPEDLLKYVVHPAHDAYVQELLPHLDDILVVNFLKQSVKPAP